MEGLKKTYVTKMVEYSPKAETLAVRVEEMANEMVNRGYELVAFSCTATGKGIVVFKKVN